MDPLRSAPVVKPKVVIDEDDPISFKEITDPVQVPCCKRVFQNNDDDGLKGWLKDHRICPMCNAEGLTQDKLIAVEKIKEVAPVLVQSPVESKFVKAPCGHSYAEDVIKAWLEVSPTCPHDHLPLTKAELLPVIKEAARLELKRKSSEPALDFPLLPLDLKRPAFQLSLAEGLDHRLFAEQERKMKELRERIDRQLNRANEQFAAEHEKIHKASADINLKIKELQDKDKLSVFWRV